MTLVNDAVVALRARRPVVLPTDTVYGLMAWPDRPEPVERVYRLKGRDPFKPIALLAASVEALAEALPELDIAQAERFLPGGYTLIVPNPEHRFPWITGGNPGTIGVRVPLLPTVTAEIVASIGFVCATSANAAGGPDPRRLEDVPEEIRSACGAVVDGGELPGVPSTVLDLTSGGEPRVLREGEARP